MARQCTDLAVDAVTANGDKPFVNRKVEATAIILGESKCTIGAWHDNYPKSVGLAAGEALDEAVMLEGKTAIEAKADADKLRIDKLRVEATPDSRDCGLCQRNITGYYIGTAVEFRLRTESLDPHEFMPVAANNIVAMAELYTTPWVFPDGKHEWRQWQAWVVAWTGWAWFTEAWAWSRVTPDTWVATGRFLHQAIRAVANYLLFIEKRFGPEKALAEAERLADLYGITKGTLFYDAKKPALGIQWHYPPKPTEPGTDADYPKKNDGRSPLSVAAAGRH